MPARRTTTGKIRSDGKWPIVFLHAQGTAPADPAWLKEILKLEGQFFSHAELEGVQKTRHRLEDLGALIDELTEIAPGCPLILIRAGLTPRPDQLETLVELLQAPDGPLALTVTSNGAGECNPFASLPLDGNPKPGQLREAVALMGRRQIHRWSWWPEHLLALSPEACRRIRDAMPTKHTAVSTLSGGLGLVEWLYVPDLRSPQSKAPRLEPTESARPMPWGLLSTQLLNWLNCGAPDIRPKGTDDQVVTLHITHSWGGGVALWTRSFIESDTSGRHLQLRSESIQPEQGHGQQLALYSHAEPEVPLATWCLQPPIQSVESHNAQYADVLTAIFSRFRVGRVLVSSLVGHSLDALRTGLPTIQVMHDYFPLWPLLSVHPADYTDNGDIDLAAALSDQADNMEFIDHDIDAWRSIRADYVSAVTQPGVHLAAPSASVIELSRQLEPALRDIDISLIPHGAPPLEQARPIPPRRREDEKLRLLVPGRIQPGKGKQLLLDSLPQLTRYAHVYLLGTGKNGEDFFGLPGVSVVLQYEREALPDLLTDLGPHVAALLSVVPETFSYTLTELQQFALPVIATRRGSFAERIDHGVNGWLIEPDPGELISAVKHLLDHPSDLEQMATALRSQTMADMQSMLRAYNELCPVGDAPGTTIADALDLAQSQAQSQAGRAVSSQVLAARERARRELAEREMVQRSQWAAKANAEVETARSRLADLNTELEERTAWTQQLNEELEAERAQTAELGKTLDAVNVRLAKTRKSLHQSRNDLQTAMFLQYETDQERQKLKETQDLILASFSWRVTRPLRAGRRALRNAKQARVYNPARWPLLLSKLVRHLATGGLAGTLQRMQAPSQSETATPRASSTADPAERRDRPNSAGPKTSAEEPVKARSVDSATATSTGQDEVEAPLHFETGESPTVSIVIPAFNQWPYTRRCLESLLNAGSQASFEVILVDDASSDQTQKAVQQVHGIQYLRNEENQGFIRSCNRGAESARGAFLVFLNNDTEVSEGWLERLAETFERVPDAGLVGAKLVYPNGRLQECGGLIFSDGDGWNYGKHDDPEKPEYQYLREVDYCSGACIMLRTPVFRELGGFDEVYAPAYYEDTDLAFRIRAHGLKVLVQPESVVIHHEGITSGTDTSSGTKRYQAINRETFLERWQAQLKEQPAHISDPEDLAQVRSARDHGCRGKVLVIDATTPEPDQDSGSVRLTNIMRCFRDLDYAVTFFADNRLHAGRYTQALQRDGVEVLYLPWHDPVKAFFRERGAEFDAIFISRHYIAVNYLSLLKQHCPDVPLIFDTVDLHYLREQRLAELEDSKTLRQVARQTRRSELGVIHAADVTVVVSPAEVEVLKKDAPSADVHVLSNIHEVPGCRNDFSQRKDLFFVGGYQHPPNIDAACWFARDVWPLARDRLPGVTFHLIGSKATDEIRELAGNGVVFHGFVEDLEPWLDGCRLAVAPLRYGAGVKGKVNMSMSYGQPVVATPVAVEGMHAENGREVLIAETPKAFADEIVRLYTDEALWRSVSAAAVENVQQHFSLDAARRSLEALMQSLADRG